MGGTGTLLESEAPSLTGLSEAEAQRRAEERGPVEPPPTSRSTASIVRANVFTFFNLILGGFGAVTLVFGEWQDALFLGIVVANSTIGIVQEMRAKRALDRLAALVAPVAAVVRDGLERPLHVDELVVGDLVRVRAGDQVVADGRLVSSDGLAIDESILTGESVAVARALGEEVRSGSFAVEGAGAYEVTAVGEDSYAERITGEARTFRHPRSPLERALNRLLFALVAAMIPLGSLLGYALWARHTSTRDTVTTAVAGIVTLIPEGLILLTSLTFAVAALRMARRGALAQQLNAIESIASAQVICLDKTGTLTEAALRVVGVEPAPGVEREAVERLLGRFAATSPARNATLEAIAHAFPAAAEAVDGYVPFASARRSSRLRLGGEDYVLGAPELFSLGTLEEAARGARAAGRRVVAFSGPPGLLGIVVIAEELRPEARETVRFFLDEGVELKVISGDAPDTVAAIAADAGIPLHGPVVDGRDLPKDPHELAVLAREATVVGRISPEGKKAFVEALAAQGIFVAMVGDGVNDVPALKAARLAIAQGTGSQMARTVADLVLVHGDFASVPHLVAEGRKVLRNLQRVTKLFVTKSCFAAFVILTVGVTPTSYPVLPRHLTLAASLTVGIPGFFLALAPSVGSWRPEGFLRKVSSFSIPAGFAAGLGVVSSYLFALNVIKLPLVEARTVAETVLIAVGLYLILALEATGKLRGAAVTTLCLLLAAAYGVVLALPAGRHFFDLAVPNLGIALSALGGALVAIVGLVLVDRQFVPWQLRFDGESANGSDGEARRP